MARQAASLRLHSSMTGLGQERRLKAGQLVPPRPQKRNGPDDGGRSLFGSEGGPDG